MGELQHLISMRELGRSDILYILDTAQAIEEGRLHPELSGKLMASLFFEPSTRTRMSFETAIKRLGGRELSMSGTAGTSVEKGESLADTVRIFARYADIIVIRHPREGAARYVSELVEVPVVNAGDGANQHPTQSLLDLYSIRKTQGTLENLDIALVGDLIYGRTVHSLVYALESFTPRFWFVSPPELRMPRSIVEELTEDMQLEVNEVESLEEVVPQVDILYVTRIQRERFPDPAVYEKVKNAYVLHPGMLTHARPNLRILHPLPRVNEIAPEVDHTEYAYYFQQAENGVFVREAILSILMGAVA